MYFLTFQGQHDARLGLYDEKKNEFSISNTRWRHLTTARRRLR